jgi:hypothetical protein
VSRRITYGRGSGQVELTGDDHALVDRLLREAYPRISGAIERKVRDVYDAAERAWPIGDRFTKDGRQWRKGGTSKAGLRWGLRIRPSEGTLEGVIWNEVDYVFYIRSDPGHVWTELVRKPMTEAVDQLVGELGDELMSAAEGR